MGFVLLLAVVGLSMFGAVYMLARLRQQRYRYTETLPESVVQVNLLDNDDAVVVAEGRGRLVFANAKARSWFNLDGGEPDLELMADAVQPAETFLELFSKEGQASFRIGNRRVEATSHYIPYQDSSQIVVVMRELVTAGYDPNVLDPVQALNVLSEIGEVIGSNLRLEETLDTILALIGKVIPFDVGEVTLWDETLQILRSKGRSGESSYFEEFDSTDGVYHLDDSFSGWIARYRQPLLIADTSLRPDVHPKLRDYPFRSFIGVPLIINDRFVGTLELGSRNRVAFDHEDMALLQTIAIQAGTAIENAWLHLNQTERLAELSGLQQIASVMVAVRDRRQMYAQLTNRVSLLMNVEMCGILLYDPEQEALVGQPPFLGVPDAIVSMYRIPIPEESITRSLYETREWWYTNNVRADDLVQQTGLLGLAEAVGVRTTALVRLSVGEQHFGVVQVANKRDGSGFSENDMRLLGVFASQVAIVVENARLYDEEQRRAAELHELEQISQAIGVLRDPDELYLQVNERIAKMMNVQMCGVLLYDEATKALVSRPPFHGVDNDLIRHYQIPLVPGNAFYDLYIEHDYWISNDLRADPILRESGLDKLAMLMGVRQTMMVPLVVSGRRLGIVQVSNRLDSRDFTEEDARVLSIFASQAAVIIDNARLYRETRERAAEAEGLRRISETAASDQPLDAVIRAVVEETSYLLNVEICTLALLDERTGGLTIHPEWSVGLDELKTPYSIDTFAPGFQASAVLSRQAFLSNNLRADNQVLPVYRTLAERYNFNSAILVPLVIRDRGVGELMVANRGDRDFTTGDLRLVKAIAALLAAAVERQRLLQATDSDLRTRIEELDAIMRISNELNRTTEFDRILEVIRTEAQHTTHAEAATIVLLDSEAAGESPGELRLNRRIGDIQGLVDLAPIEQAAIQQRMPIVVDDYAASDLAPQPPEARNAIAAPVVYGEQPVGALHIYSGEPGTFAAETQDFIRTLVNQVAIAFGNESRYRDQLERADLLRQRTDQLNRIFELGGMLRSGASLEDVLEAVAHSIAETMAFNVVVISIVDRGAGVTRRIAQAGLPLSVWEKQRKVTPPLSFLDRMFKPRYQISGSYFLPAEAKADWALPDMPLIESPAPTHADAPNAWDPEDLLLIPLRGSATGELIGLISVDDPRSGQRPTVRTIEALETFAYQAAFAVENYQLVQAYQAEADAVRRERDRLAQLHLVASEIQRSPDMATRLQVVAEGIRSAGWGRVAITLRDQNLEPLETITAGYTPEAYTQLKANLLSGVVWSQRLADPEFRHYRIGQAYYIRHDAPLVTENKLIAGIGEDEKPAEAVESGPADAWHPLDTVYLPLYGLDRSRVIGIIAMDSPVDGKLPTESSMRPIELFAVQAASAIENTRLYQAMINAAQQEARINEVTEAITATLELEEIIQAVAQGFQQMIAFTRMSVGLLQEGHERFEVIRVKLGMHGEVETETGEPIAADNSAMGLAVQESAPRVYHLEAEEQIGDYADLRKWRESGERTSLVVPMLAGGRVVGALHMGSELADAFGFEAQLPLVARIANLTAVAIENAQLFQQAIDRERFSSALSRVGQSVSAMLDMSNVLDTICEESIGILGVAGAYIWLVEGSEMVGLAARGPNAGSFPGIRVSLDEADVLGAAVIREHAPVYLNIADSQESQQQSVLVTEILRGVSVHAILGVPLLREDQAIGAIVFIQTDPERLFAATDIEKASAFAVQAAIAIENTRLYQETLGLTSFNEAIVQSIQQGIVVLGRDKRIRTVNAFMKRVYGWTDEAVGQALFGYRPNYADFLQDAVEGVLQTGSPETRYAVRDVDEHNRAVVRNFYVYPLLEGETVSGIVILVEDVTARTALEADLANRAQQLSVLTEMSTHLTALLEPGAVIQLMFDQLDRILEYDRATLWLRESDKLVITAARGFAEAESLIGIEAEIADSDLFREIASRGQVLNIPDVTQDNRFPPLSEAHPMRSWLGVSLVSRGNLAGLLVLEKAETYFYDPTMEQLALTFANQVAVALENASLFQETTQAAEENTRLYREAASRAQALDQQAQRLALLYRVSNALTQSLDLEAIFEVALRETVEMLGTDRGSAFILDPDHHAIRLVVEYPRDENASREQEGIPLSGNPIIEEIRQTLQPVVVPDVPGNPEAMLSQLSEQRVLSMMIVPLTVSGQLIGLFAFDSVSDYREFTPEQVDVAQTIALQAAIAVQNANLLEQSLARTRELETLFEAAQSVSATLDLTTVLHTVATQMMVALEADACGILTWESTENVLTVALDLTAGGDKKPKHAPGTSYALADYPARERALLTRQVVLIHDDDPNLSKAERKLLKKHKAHSCVILPMAIREQSIGLIEVETHSAGRLFTTAEVRLARTLASQAAAAVENARLQTETASKLEELFVLNDLSTALAATIEQERIFEIVESRLPSLVRAQLLLLAVLAEDGETVTYPFALKEGELMLIDRHPLGDDEISFILRQGTPQRLAGDEITEVLRNRGAQLRITQARSLLGVPLIAGTEIVGALVLSDEHSPHAFSLNDQRILSTVGAQLAVSLQNSRLFAQTRRFTAELEQAVLQRTMELQRERDNLDFLYQLTASVTSSLDIDITLSHALEMMVEAVEADMGVILSIDNISDELVYRAGMNLQVDKGQRAGVSPREGLAGWVIQSQQSVVVPDVQTDYRWLHAGEWEREPRAAIAALLEANEETLGVVMLYSCQPDKFTEDQLRLVVAASKQIASAMNNADLYALIREQAERLGAMVRREQVDSTKNLAIVESIADGVMVANQDGVITQFNSAAERILGLSRREVIGNHISSLAGLHASADGPHWFEAIERWTADPTQHRTGEEVRTQFELESGKFVAAILSPVNMGDQFLGTVSVFRDVTREIEVDRVKSEFVATVSHELRTPMTSIKGYADLMLLGAAGVLNEQQQRFLTTIKANADRLSVLVNELLDISRIDRGTVRLNLQPTNLADIVELSLQQVRERMATEGKEVEVTTDVPEDLPLLRADFDKLTQLLNHLLNNAYSYTPPGGQIRLSARPEARTVLISITDTGIGIAREKQDKIWNRFFRDEEQSAVMETSGAGLGLAIVKEYVEMHEGETWVESEEGQGATFYVRIPALISTS